MKIWDQIKDNKQINNRGIKLIAGMLMALFFSILISKQFFYYDSPAINHTAFDNIKNLAYEVVRLDFGTSLDSSLPVMSENSIPPNLNFLPIAPGVYAATDPTTNIRYAKLEKGVQVRIEEHILIDGRKIKVITPLP